MGAVWGLLGTGFQFTHQRGRKVAVSLPRHSELFRQTQRAQGSPQDGPGSVPTGALIPAAFSEMVWCSDGFSAQIESSDLRRGPEEIGDFGRAFICASWRLMHCFP